MEKNILKPEIWHKIIDGFNKDKLEYVLVGGAALAAHGIPRSTLDIDIYIVAEADIISKLFQIADGLRLKSEQKAILALARSGRLIANQWISFSYEGRDILDVFLCEEKEFKRISKRAKLEHDKDTAVRVASLKDIEKMKKASGRPVDIADIDLIKKAKRIQVR